MVKLMVVFFIGLMVCSAIAQDNPDDYQAGGVGETVIYGEDGCVKNDMGKCSRNTKCCSPRVCWIDGKCDTKVPSGFSSDGLEFVSGKVGAWQRYDSCEDSKGRIGDSCSVEDDCCFPLDCTSGQCVTISGMAQMFAALRGYGRA